jgi:hypothetical protein
MSIKFNDNPSIKTNPLVPYTEQSNDLSGLPEELIKVIFSYCPSRQYPLICKTFYQIFMNRIKDFPNTENKLIFQVFHNLILNNLINSSTNCLETHSFMVNATEKLYPFATGLPGNKNEKTTELLSQTENLEINKIVNFWESCHGDLSRMSFNDIVLIDCLLNGHYPFALEVFKTHPDYPLNISPWRMNGEVRENKAYTEIRKKIISCMGSYLIDYKRTHEFLAILSKEYRKIIESHLKWGNLLYDNLKEDILNNLNISKINSEKDLVKIFSDLFQKSEIKDFPDLAIGLALIYPDEEFELSEAGETVYTKALQCTVEKFIENELKDDLIDIIINILNNNEKH